MSPDGLVRGVDGMLSALVADAPCRTSVRCAQSIPKQPLTAAATEDARLAVVHLVWGTLVAG